MNINSSEDLENIANITAPKGGWLDITGAMVSWACAVHCLALPFAVALLPLIGLSFLLDERVEWTIISGSILVGVLSFLPAYFRQHRKLRAAALFIAGISLIIAAHLLFEDNFAAQIVFILSGAILMTAAHLINRHLCRSCTRC